MDPPHCANGCGRYGSAEYKNLCSNCHNDNLKKQVTSKSAVTDIYGATTGLDLSGSSSMKNEKMRCKICNKKIVLLGFECRCGHVFCGKHRHPEDHKCKVDLKEIGRQVLATQNPKCIPDKLERRI
ncbi:hypothetical protein VNO77_35141 [Canavalia gladiata]|uniref:Uncharacterized protein n=1 Tax=Canavalia gladiata TaxID=3824 RepID=A0AAN9KH72_CANGL